MEMFDIDAIRSFLKRDVQIIRRHQDKTDQLSLSIEDEWIYEVAASAVVLSRKSKHVVPLASFAYVCLFYEHDQNLTHALERAYRDYPTDIRKHLVKVFVDSHTLITQQAS